MLGLRSDITGHFFTFTNISVHLFRCNSGYNWSRHSQLVGYSQSLVDGLSIMSQKGLGCKRSPKHKQPWVEWTFPSTGTLKFVKICGPWLCQTLVEAVNKLNRNPRRHTQAKQQNLFCFHLNKHWLQLKDATSLLLYTTKFQNLSQIFFLNRD